MSKIELIFRENMDEYVSKIKEENPNVKFYSHSRLGNFNQCKRGYYYTYVDKKEQKPSVYSTLGTAAHSTLENLYEGKTEILDNNIFLEEFSKCELFGINFPVSKFDIKGGYKKDIDNFYKVYNKIESKEGDKFISELGFILKIDEDHYEMGYIDLLVLHNDNTCDIYDFKTSSDFDAKKVVEAGRQLILYKIAIEQLYGIKVNKVAWQMLKYVQVKVGNNATKYALKGREWVKKCSSQIKTLMKKLGYDTDLISMYISKAEADNSIDCLPNDVKELIYVDVYTREYEVTDALIKECIDYTRNTIKDIEDMNFADISVWPCEVDDFFCCNLCGFYPKHCQKE